VNKFSFLFVFLAVIPLRAADRPNLVFMIADDCTYLDMELYGGQAKTPHLIKLASQGMQFSRCFQTAPMCSPTRHNIYTGIYPVRSGAWPNHTCVYPGTKSIAHYLKPAGYRVALSGKTHIAPRASFPFEYDGEFKNNNPYRKPAYPTIQKLISESKAAGTPFCLFACSNEPHSPYTKGDPSAYPPESLKLPPSWADTPETRSDYSKYLAEITWFDQQCGTLLGLLEEQGVADNTLVMVVSEQGSAFPFAKWTCFEMGLASGMVVRWPGHVRPGSRTDALVEYCDVAPTFLEAAGLGVPDSMDGKSFLSVLRGQSAEHKKYTFGLHTTRGIINGSENFGIRSCGTKTHRYIRNLNAAETFSNAVMKVRTNRPSFWQEWLQAANAGDRHAAAMTQKYMKRPAEELYDVQADPHCLKNLIDDPDYVQIRRELSHQLDAWMKSQGDEGAATEAIAHTRKAAYQKQQQSKKTKKQNKAELQ
jgi:uncharacterized sulfatase